MRRASLPLVPVLAGLMLLCAEGAAAQQRAATRRAKPAAEAPPPAGKPLPPPASPQEKPLAELAETMGALAFLTQICAPATAVNPWRARMEALIESEGEASGARERMTGAYNRGFSDYATTYRQCTDAARAARGLLTRDAARLSREIERRFGS